MSYESFRKSWGPSWLQQPGGQDWQAAHGRFADKLVSQVKSAVLSQFPGLCPSDALPYLGNEIGIPRSPAGTDESYGEKLQRAWEVWPFAGTPLGILLAFEAAGYPAGQVVVVQQESHGFGLNADTSLAPEERLVIYGLISDRWTFTDSSTLWNRFGVLFHDPNNLPSGWASAVSPPTTSSTPTLDTVNGLIRLVNKWKRAASIFQWIKVVTVDDGVWGWPLDDEWGDGTWGGGVVTFGPSEY